MKVLLGGSADYPLFTTLAKRLSRHPAVESVGIWSMRPLRTGHLLESLGVEVYAPGSRIAAPVGVRGTIKVVRGRRQLRRLAGWDVLSLHYLHPQLGLLAGPLASAAPRLVTSLWGSDLYRPGRFARQLQRRVLERSHAITVLHGEMTAEVRTRFGHRMARRTREVRFGLDPLDPLRSMAGSGSRFRSEFGLPEEGYAVAIGYNGSPGQNHLEVLAALEASELPGSITLVLPLLYGGDTRYRARVREAAERSRFSTRVLEERMEAEKIARFRKSIDVLIHVQPSDALSGSMQEHLYAGTVVITGSWLKYGILDERGIPVERVDRIALVPTRLAQVLENLGSYRSRLEASREAIWRLSSWEANLAEWVRVLRGDPTPG